MTFRSMSVPVTMVVVYKSVPTLLVATHVDVTLDMSWMEMDSHAMVRICLELTLCQKNRALRTTVTLFFQVRKAKIDLYICNKNA